VNGDQSRESHKQLLRELNEERVAALRRISRTLESLIGQLHASRERVRQVSGAERERQVAAMRDLRDRALKYRWYLEVQRESLGFRRHDGLDEFYKVPAIDELASP
jgi:DNA-directed RNA polymerase sigma subunit (sigma70/sigma32)